MCSLGLATLSKAQRALFIAALLALAYLASFAWQRARAPFSLCSDGCRWRLVPHSGAPPLPIPHNLTATCLPLAFDPTDPPGCADEYTHPFSGCLTPAYEHAAFQRLLDPGVRPPLEVRCGFMDPRSQDWLAALHRRTAGCTAVVYSVSLSYGLLPSTAAALAAASPPGTCWLGFVDEGALRELRSQPGFETGGRRRSSGNSSSNGGPAAIRRTAARAPDRYGAWQLVRVGASLFSNSTARSAHLLKILAPRLFPTARVALYVDAKASAPPSATAVFAAMETYAAQGRPLVFATALHPVPGRDVFQEIIDTLAHLKVGVCGREGGGRAAGGAGSGGTSRRGEARQGPGL